MDNNQQGFFSRKLRAGKKRSYFFDVKATKQGDYFVTITESKRRYDRPGYDSHKIYLYKEDFKSFQNSLDETLSHIKTELNPEFDYENYDREVYNAQVEAEGGNREENERPKKPSRTQSEVRSGSYLDKYEDTPAKPVEDTPKVENDTSDADAMEF
ncbi:MAG: DUF3276 family protein [Chitinophagales bacterium]|mgnify:CR=1 FL=1